MEAAHQISEGEPGVEITWPQISEGAPDLEIEPQEPTEREVVEPVLTGDDRAALRAAVSHLAEAVEAWIEADGLGDAEGVTEAQTHYDNALSVVEGVRGVVPPPPEEEP